MGLLSRAEHYAVDPILGLLGRLTGQGQPQAGYSSASPGFDPNPQPPPQPPQAMPAPQRQPSGLGAFLRIPGALGGAILDDLQSGPRDRQVAAQRQADFQRALGQLGGGGRPAPQGQDPSQVGAGAGIGPGAPQGGQPHAMGLREAAPLILQMQGAGYKTDDIVSLLDKISPNIKIGPDGQPYDERDPATMQRRFANRTNINGFVTDLNNPENEGKYLPQLPVGAIPHYDRAGNVTAVTLADGTTQAIAAQEGAKANATEAAKANYDISTINLPNGSTAQMPRSQAIQALGGRGGPVGPGAGIPGAPGLPGGLGQSQAPSEAVYKGKRAEASAGRLTDIIKAGDNARQTVGQLNQISALTDGLATGKLTPAQVAGNQLLSNFGIQIAGLSNAEAAQAIMSKLTLSMMGGSLGSGFSNADRDFVISQAPNLSQTPQGRATLVKYLKVGADNQTQQTSFARKWEQRYGSIDAPDPQGRAFEEQWGRWLEGRSVQK